MPVELSAVLSHKPDEVLIEFTTNDAYLPNKISLRDSTKNLNMMIDRILTTNSQTEIILQTMNPIVDKADTPSATIVQSWQTTPKETGRSRKLVVYC